MSKKKKKKYIKPEVKVEKIKETALLMCGKCIAGFPHFGHGCKAVPRFS